MGTIAQKNTQGNSGLDPEFAGTFDGQDYTIKNVPLTNALTVNNSDSRSVANDYKGVLSVGLFVGRNYGTIDNCTVNGKRGGFVNFDSGTISNCVSIITGSAD
ncbi:MAG: hypothetical protein IKT98_07950 [Selenomonadaceae bacterium]|nr:hypothetical protein [Selenomonadaceae bacterium]